MDEDKTKVKPEVSPEAEPEVKKELPAVKAAREQAERIEAANKKTEELLERQENLLAQQSLGGQTETGAPMPKAAPISDKEYAEKIMRGEANPLKDDGLI